MFFTQKLSLKFRPGLTKERVDLHEIAHYRSNVVPMSYVETNSKVIFEQKVLNKNNKQILFYFKVIFVLQKKCLKNVFPFYSEFQ